MKKILYILLLIAMTPGLKAQFAAVLSDKEFTRLENDSVLLAPNKDLRGTLQWQKSSDSMNWANVESNLTGDILSFAPEVTEAYRLQIREGTCLPLYSDPVKVFSKNTTVSEYHFAGFSNHDLIAAGASVSDLLDAGVSFIELLDEGIFESRIDSFTFSSNGRDYNGKIFLPAFADTNQNLPAIFLIDFTETHFKLVTDEFEKVIDGVQQIQGFDALVVSLEQIADIDAEPGNFQEHYNLFKNMAFYVDGKYTNNQSRTFIGKGSESGIVLKALLLEDSVNAVFDNFIATDPSGLYGTEIIRMLENNDFSQNKPNKKLHFSFSTSNDRTKCMKLIRLFKEAQYPWLQFEGIEYTNSNYDNTYPVSYPAGIKYIFDE